MMKSKKVALVLLSLLCAGSIGNALAGDARGVVRSATRVDIVSDLNAPVTQTPFLPGQAFSTGEVLIAFDCSRYEAELSAARANYAAASVELKQKQHLLKFGATGRTEVDLANAQTARANAEIKVVQARMAGCTITAPFDGRVVDLAARPAEMPSVGEVLMTVIDIGTLEIELVVPSRWLRDVKPGSQFSFETDETGTVHAGRVDRIGAEVDPVSQTVKLYGSFNDPDRRVLAGMSGNARFAGVAIEDVTGALQ